MRSQARVVVIGGGAVVAREPLYDPGNLRLKA